MRQQDSEFGLLIFDRDRWILEHLAKFDDRTIQVCVEPEVSKAN